MHRHSGGLAVCALPCLKSQAKNTQRWGKVKWKMNNWILEAAKGLFTDLSGVWVRETQPPGLPVGANDYGVLPSWQPQDRGTSSTMAVQVSSVCVFPQTGRKLHGLLWPSLQSLTVSLGLTILVKAVTNPPMFDGRGIRLYLLVGEWQVYIFKEGVRLEILLQSSLKNIICLRS